MELENKNCLPSKMSHILKIWGEKILKTFLIKKIEAVCERNCFKILPMRLLNVIIDQSVSMCLRHVYQMSSTADRVSALITILPTTDNIVENFEFKVNDSHEYDCEKQDFIFRFTISGNHSDSCHSSTY